MTNFEVIKQMNQEELAFFLAVVELNDSNAIPNIDVGDVDYFKEYLNKDGEGLLKLTRELLSKVSNLIC